MDAGCSSVCGTVLVVLCCEALAQMCHQRIYATLLVSILLSPVLFSLGFPYADIGRGTGEAKGTLAPPNLKGRAPPPPSFHAVSHAVSQT